VKPVNSFPATATTVLGAAAALIIAFGHLSAASSALVISLAGAVGTVVITIAGAIAGKPVSMQVVTGVATVIFSDLALFGIHMDSDQRGALAGAVTVALGIMFHLLHVTVAVVPLKATAVTADPALAPLIEREGP
jgi:lysylphosphatidylglycerol synthetase-like protein (DUF2156 family)